jgi:sulfate transport system permease protein
MAGIVKRQVAAGRAKSQRGTEESPLAKWTLIGIAMTFCLVFLLLPLVNVFAQAFSKGWSGYWQAISHPDAWAAMKLTLLIAAISVPLNVVFGLAAAWVSWQDAAHHAD